MAYITFNDDIERHYYKLMTAIVLMIVGAITFVILGPESLAGFLLGEGGTIETLSAAGYLVAVVALFREATTGFLKRHFYFVVVPLAMCLREMDFHNQLTTMSITKSSFYVSAAVPWLEKIGAVAVLGLLAWCGYLLVRRHGRDFLHGLKRHDATAAALLGAGLLAVASKSLDGIPRKLEALGIHLAGDAATASAIVEETFELGIPVFLVIAIFAFFARTDGMSTGSARR